jgi:hypothetical protein
MTLRQVQNIGFASLFLLLGACATQQNNQLLLQREFKITLLDASEPLTKSLLSVAEERLKSDGLYPQFVTSKNVYIVKMDYSWDFLVRISGKVNSELYKANDVYIDMNSLNVKTVIVPQTDFR